MVGQVGLKRIKRKEVIIMAKLRETPCESYICLGSCKKGRDAAHLGYCQHCNKYRPRAKVRHLNKKKAYNNSIKDKE